VWFVIRAGQAFQSEEMRQGDIEAPTQIAIAFVRFRSPAPLVTADVTLKSLARNPLAARGLAELVAIKIRSTFFPPKQTATPLPGSWSHKR
jgi:hypothetical protein